MKQLEDENEWIKVEREHFGRKDHFYDFENMNINELAIKAKKLATEIEDAKKRVNFKVDSMVDELNERYTQLSTKKQTIEKDRDEVLETVRYMNQKMHEELQDTWKVVSKYCAQIFSTLLPNAQAKLALADEEAGVEKGLELKVGFNGKWKESLSELSGGQRSLLALSLILALLRYQPAPLYILDEIDSALDLHHTQNIGLMIKRYFKNSQFLIVSLKEGLFQNANVLYQVQFLDNRSQVKRLAIAQKKVHQVNDQQEE